MRPLGRICDWTSRRNRSSFRMRDARSEARAEERLADNDPGAEGGVSRHWKIVRELAVEALTKSTKDLEIAAC